MHICRGHKDVLKKRLKTFYKRKYTAHIKVAPVPKRPTCDYYVVIDFEATCDLNSVRYAHEIIEFPAVLVNAADGTVVSSINRYIQSL